MRRPLSLIAVLALPVAGCLVDQNKYISGFIDAGPPGGCASPTGQLTAMPAAIDFGSDVVNSTTTQLVTVSNCTENGVVVTPGQPGDPFTVNDTVPTVLAAGDTLTLTVTYKPLVPSRLDSGSLQIFFSGSAPPAVVALQGVGLQSGLILQPLPLAFGFVPPGQTLPLALHLSNIGNEIFLVTSAALVDPGTPAAFSLPDGGWTGGQLAPGESVDVTVTFAPPQAGRYDGELDIATTESVNIIPVNLVGYGGGAAISCSPLSLDFGTVAANLGTSLPVICTNTGTDVPDHPEAGVILSTLVTDNPLYSAQVDPASVNPASPSQPLAAGQMVQLDVTYLPTSTSSDLGTLKINSNATDGTSKTPPAISLSGSAISEPTCVYTISPASLDFGPVPVGTTATSSFTITDTGTSECLVNPPQIAAGCDSAFALPGGPLVSQRLSAGDGGPFPNAFTTTLTFTPPDAGGYQCTLEFFGGTGAVPITGTGTE